MAGNDENAPRKLPLEMRGCSREWRLIGQLQPFTSSKIHAGTDRSQGAADVARCRKRGERSPKQTVRDWGRNQAWKADRTCAGYAIEVAPSIRCWLSHVREADIRRLRWRGHRGRSEISEEAAVDQGNWSTSYRASLGVRHRGITTDRDDYALDYVAVSDPCRTLRRRPSRHRL